MNARVIKVAASTFVLGVTMVGCKPAVDNYRPATASSRATRNDQVALRAYERAQEAVSKGNLSAALAAMEQAVAFSPQDAGYRMGLAELYMKSGRFASAEATFADVLALNPSDSHAGFYRAITLIAQGKSSAAIAQLDGMDSNVAPADLGLAYALAGEPSRALALLEPAARSAQANGRIRQNLALTYALAGDWKKARVTAAQDVSPAEIDNRMQQWAALASPQAGATRVASLLGVTPAKDDPGQPARLALAPAAPASATSAYAAPEPAPAPSPVPVAVAQAEPTAPAAEAVPPVVIAAAQVATPAPAAPIAAAPAPAAAVPEAAQPAEAPAPAAPAVAQQYVQAAATLVGTSASQESRFVPKATPAYIRTVESPRAKRPGTGRYVVQIGAFSTSAQVERAWTNAQRRYGFDGSAQPVSTTVTVPGKGLFHRLSIAGFGSQGSAVRVCETVRARGGACFVRTVAGDAPMQWASRTSRKA